MKLYGEMARLWDIITDPEDYLAEAERIKCLIDKHHGKARTLLDIGCGTGRHHRYLKSDFSITGMDRYPSMIEMARFDNPDIGYFVGDMTTFHLTASYDVITVMDAIVYCTDYLQLEKALRNLSDHLKERGLLIITLDQLREDTDRREMSVNHYRHGGRLITFIECDYDPDPGDDSMETALTFIIREKEKIEAITDIHKLGLFEARKMERLLSKYFIPVDHDDPVSPEGAHYFLCIGKKIRGGNGDAD